MLTDRQRHDLDNYTTGHYGEDQFRGEEDPGLCPDDLEDMSGHEYAIRETSMCYVYSYDPAADGPECEVITRILAYHPLYRPGQELGHLRFLAQVNGVARQAYGRRYEKLGPRQKARVRFMVAAVRGGIRQGAS